jgi:hypothetical protein
MEYVEYDQQGRVKRRQRQGDALQRWVDEVRRGGHWGGRYAGAAAGTEPACLCSPCSRPCPAPVPPSPAAPVPPAAPQADALGRQDDALDASQLETVMEDFEQFGWEQFDDEEEQERLRQQQRTAGLLGVSRSRLLLLLPRARAAALLAQASRRGLPACLSARRLPCRPRPQDGEEEDSIEARALRDMANDDDWGLEGLGERPKTYLAEVEARAKALGNRANDVQWGGSVSATGGAGRGLAGGCARRAGQVMPWAAAEPRARACVCACTAQASTWRSRRRC